jgi:hypothetical protein
MRPLSTNARACLERLGRTTCPLYPAEIGQGARVDQVDVSVALSQLYARGLIEPRSWGLTEAGVAELAGETREAA